MRSLTTDATLEQRVLDSVFDGSWNGTAYQFFLRWRWPPLSPESDARRTAS